MNGQIPDEQLVVIDAAGTRLLRSTAAMWLQLQEDAREAGHVVAITVTREPWGAIGGYRTLAEQRFLSLHPLGPAKIGKPGTQSHGTGTVFDVTAGGPATAWLIANRARYGIRQTIDSEPWHWSHDGTIPAGNTGTPLPEELDMAGITILPKARIIVWPNGWTNAYDPNVIEAIRLVVEDGDTEPSRVATLTREAWKAVDGMLNRQVTAIEKRAQQANG